MSVLLLGQLENATRFRVDTQQFQPNTLDQSIIDSGHLVDSTPVDTPQQDKKSTLYLNPSTSEMWYEYTPINSTEVQRLQELESQNAQMLLALVNGGLM